MNQPLKLKWHSIYGQILFDRKLTAAWKQVEKNDGAGGIDGETIASFRQNEEQNIMKLLGELRSKTYKPTAVKRVYIPKKNGKLRPLGIPCIRDRIVQQAIVNVLSPKCEEQIFHRWSCGYRPNLGATRVAQLILWNIETGYNHVYDCDIKGFFDNISHKKLMKILTKYIADGTVLDLIWAWLKAGYMEEGRHYDTESGTPQGGVISPLLANLFLNELDWVLEEHKIRFVRYADDFLLFAKSKEDIERAAKVARDKLEELGLEVATEKTKFVDFNKDDFDFMGFTFHHWRERKKDRKLYFMVKPTKSSLKGFKAKIKELTPKRYTLNSKVWLEKVNPVIRGKVNYYLTIHKAIQKNLEYGQQSRCVAGFVRELDTMDAYTRQRLRVAMAHKNAGQRKGHLMKSRWNNEFFARIGLIPSSWLYLSTTQGYTMTAYLSELREKSQRKLAQTIQRYKAQGKEYYTALRLQQMRYAHRV